MSLRNATGECVSRPVPGRSTPRGASAPPQTRVGRVERLHRVVGPREQGEVGRCGRVGPVGVELGQPEAVQVGLVPDDHVLHGRELLLQAVR